VYTDHASGKRSDRASFKRMMLDASKRKHGLLSRDKLAGPEYMARASDYYRLDGRGDAISVSISRVNSLMFEAKRYKSGPTDWVILVLPSHILWTHDCLFSWRNAAKKEIRDHRGWRGGPWAFSKMFDGSKEERNGFRTVLANGSSSRGSSARPNRARLHSRGYRGSFRIG
jgi:hypothetical protein